MKTQIAVSLLAMLVMGSASGQSVLVRGMPDCGEWVKDRQQRERAVFAAASELWVVGYLSGLAIGLNTNLWGHPNVNELRPESVFLWIDNYCRANPLKNVDAAANALFVERCPKPSACR